MPYRNKKTILIVYLYHTKTNLYTPSMVTERHHRLSLPIFDKFKKIALFVFPKTVPWTIHTMEWLQKHLTLLTILSMPEGYPEAVAKFIVPY